MNRQAACVLCQAPANQSVPDCDGYLLCRRCDVSWSQVEDPADPAGEWDRDYYGDETVLRLHLGRESAMKGIVRRLAKLCPIRGRLLDVGTGVGVLLKVAARDGWLVEGVEASPTAARWARQLTGATVHEGLLEDVRLEPEAYDVVTCLDALRLVPDPAALLALSRRLLRPGGLLLVREVHRAAERRYLRLSATPGHGQVKGRRRAFQYGQLFSPRSLLYALRAMGMVECRIEPSPLFLESETGVHLSRRFLKQGLSLAGAAAFRLTAGTVILTPNLLALGRTPSGAAGEALRRSS